MRYRRACLAFALAFSLAGAADDEAASFRAWERDEKAALHVWFEETLHRIDDEAEAARRWKRREIGYLVGLSPSALARGTRFVEGELGRRERIFDALRVEAVQEFNRRSRWMRETRERWLSNASFQVSDVAAGEAARRREFDDIRERARQRREEDQSREPISFEHLHEPIAGTWFFAPRWKGREWTRYLVVDGVFYHLEPALAADLDQLATGHDVESLTLDNRGDLYWRRKTKIVIAYRAPVFAGEDPKKMERAAAAIEERWRRLCRRVLWRNRLERMLR